MNKQNIVYPTILENEYYFEEGCHIIEILNQKDCPNLSIARARVAPHSETTLHALNNTIELYYILSGQGLTIIDNYEETVKPGDIVKINPGCSQKIINSSDCDLIFLCICHPRFKKENYRGNNLNDL